MDVTLQQLATAMNISYQDIIILVTFLAIAQIWSLIWKGLALWKSAKKHQPIWFVVLLVMNTLGILEILYIFLFSEMKKEKIEKRKKR